MFKLFFLGLVDVSSLEINLALVKQGRKYPKLNDYTVRMYHNLFILMGRKNAKRNR
jgi:hypothetical protein